MPDSPVTRGDVALLAQQVGALQRTVHEAIGTMAEGLALRPTKAEIHAQRKRFIVWSLILLLISSVITIITLSTVVSECFLTVPKGTLYSICSVIPDYDRTEKVNKKTLNQFHHLLGQIPVNEGVNRQQQHEINRLRAVLRKHGIKP